GRRRSGIVDNSAKESLVNVDNLLPATIADSSKGKTRIVCSARAVKNVPDATTRSRFPDPQPTRLHQRSPVREAAPVQKSKRTPPQCEVLPSRRGPRIRSTVDRPGDGNTRRTCHTGEHMDTLPSDSSGTFSPDPSASD